MLRMAVNITWKAHLTNEQLYQNLPPVSDNVVQRRLRLAGHCVRHSEEVASDLVLWKPLDGRINRGRKKTTFVDTLLQDTGMANPTVLKTCMMDRNIWNKHVMVAVRSGDRPR